MSPSRCDGDGAGAGHRDHALVLYTFCMVKLFAVDTPLALRNERVDGLVAVHAFVAFCKSRSFAKPE